MLEKYYKDPCKSVLRLLQMPKNAYESLRNAVANLTNVLRMKQQHDTCVAYLHIHIAGLSFVCYFLGPISLFPIILILIVRILSLYYKNINTNASHLYKRPTITTNALPLIRMACELLPNMLRICVFTNFMNLFLKFLKPREQPRMYTNTTQFKAITMRPLRFVTELRRYYVKPRLH